ncbi:MAG: hypothetical protein H3C39_03035 [Flavobacteriia bacterium]|mgnify:CR=1 FL=1|nr:hypothetical protein [Flavobacteriia bacterium]
MKNLFKISILMMLAFSLTACGSKEETTAETQSENVQNDDPMNVTKIMSTEKGDTVVLTFFPKGDEFAIKLKIDGQEVELDPKGTSDKGNPVFSDGNYGWEMFVDGRSGRLFTNDSEGQFYKER